MLHNFHESDAPLWYTHLKKIFSVICSNLKYNNICLFKIRVLFLTFEIYATYGLGKILNYITYAIKNKKHLSQWIWIIASPKTNIPPKTKLSLIYPASISLFKVNNGNIRAKENDENYERTKSMTLSCIFNVNFEHISRIALVFL